MTRETLMNRLSKLSEVVENGDQDVIIAALNPGHRENHSQLRPGLLVRQELGQVLTTLRMKIQMNALSETKEEIVKIIESIDKIQKKYQDSEIDFDTFGNISFSQDILPVLEKLT